MNYDIELFGHTINIVKKRIKSLRITIKYPSAEIIVSSPLFLTKGQVVDFLSQKKDWIEKSYNSVIEKRRYEDIQDGIFLFNQKIAINYVLDKKNFYAFQNYLLTIYYNKEENKERVINKFYKDQLMQILPNFLIKWQNVTGLFAESYAVKNMKSRWGSCVINKKRLYFNLQLCKHPQECIEYVVLHELCHLKYAGHGQNFKNLMSQYMPDWKIRRKILNN